MTEQLLIGCTEDGRRLGTLTWNEAHASPGTLHKAFSIYVFRNGEFLLQQRSNTKPLWAGIWANTCCSHPRNGEQIDDAAHRRLKEECGFDCPLSMTGELVYRADDPGGNGSEHEHVTLFLGEIDQRTTPEPNPDEVAALRWIGIEELQHDMKEHPERYAPWFHLGLPTVLATRTS